MDTKANLSLRHIIFSLLAGAAALPGVFVLPVLTVLPAFFAFIASAWGMGCFVAACASAVLCTYLSCGMELLSAACLIAVYLPASVVLSVFIRLKKPWRTAAGAASAAICAGLYCVFCLPSLISGEGPFAVMESAARELTAGTASLLPIDALTGGNSAISEYLAVLPELMPMLTVFFIMTMGMGFGFFDTLIARALAKKSGVSIRPMAPMREWQLSRSFAWGALILIIGLIIIVSNNIIYANAISTAIELIVLLPYMLSGVCFFEFLGWKQDKNMAVRRVLGGAAAVLLMPFSVYALALGGLLDRLFHIRERLMNPPPEY